MNDWPGHTGAWLWRLVVLTVLCMPLLPAPVKAGGATLEISFGGDTRLFTRGELLKRSDVQDLSVAHDVAYGRPMTYKAVPLLDLLGGPVNTSFDVVEARASDGFVAQIPVSLINGAATGGSVPWVAIEDPAAPWPMLPKKTINAGPFYLVWQYGDRSDVGPEQWPFKLTHLTGERAPWLRWPQMAVAEGEANAPARRGMHVFVKNCLACHQIDGAGDATIGPDMAKPMSPVDYMTPLGLRQLLRDPTKVRDWPGQQMFGYGEDVISDSELDDLIVYLGYFSQTGAN